MPSGAKKRKAEKKKKEQLAKTGEHGESKEEVSGLDVGGSEEPNKSAAGAVDAKDSPAGEGEVGGKEEGKSSSGSGDSSSDSSSDEERLEVDVPISDSTALPASAVNGSNLVDDEGRGVGVEIEVKADSFVDGSKAMSGYSPGHTDDVAEEVAVEATPPIAESDLIVESVVANTFPSSERIVDVAKPVEVGIRETIPENQGVEQEVGRSAPLPVERTSWRNCCGLFELFSGAK